MKYIIFLLLFLFMSGCATVPEGALAYDKADVGEPTSEKGVVVLYRKMVPPVMYSVTATLNGKAFSKLPNKSFVWAYVEPGKHEIKIKWPFIATTPGETINLNVEPGKYYFVEFGGSTNVSGVGVAYNTHDLNLDSPEYGLQDVKECCRQMPSQL
ncbi:DUF2846 domain-containing protein [Microbulbifer halophilus]|uniref:DUF2846 domain-containing protein n=1 Tax=Microbulbifer halophilus TaxID=453963 RepID=A0ABW5EFR1_9GAMM|nr:DUF2846 domain-containing protein [Microbulbifer halophilus]MCW8127834.1 DUF2846 domain-containing protein [Microbulbifer halophilus]